jgi:hypothetical protein
VQTIADSAYERALMCAFLLTHTQRRRTTPRSTAGDRTVSASSLSART